MRAKNSNKIQAQAVKVGHLKVGSLVGMAMFCSAAVTGCEKSTKTEAEQAVVAPINKANDMIVLKDTQSLPIIDCDDQVAVTELMQTIKYTLNTQTQRLLKQHLQQADAALALDDSRANNAIGAVLVDLDTPHVLQSANDHGMVTCQASLSLTLPSNDVYRAIEVYEAMGGDSLQQRLQAEHIVLNNNMLVTNEFNYVVGMQGGQATARVVGQPVILTAATDIMAKSQFNAAMDAARKHAVVVSAAEPYLPNEPLAPTDPDSPHEPILLEDSSYDAAVIRNHKAMTAPERPARGLTNNDGITPKPQNKDVTDAAPTAGAVRKAPDAVKLNLEPKAPSLDDVKSQLPKVKEPIDVIDQE